ALLLDEHEASIGRDIQICHSGPVIDLLGARCSTDALHEKLRVGARNEIDVVKPFAVGGPSRRTIELEHRKREAGGGWRSDFVDPELAVAAQRDSLAVR